MPKFNCHNRQIETTTFDAAYAIRFEVSIAQAIADRDEPMTAQQLRDRFRAAALCEPTLAEMEIMYPNSEGAIVEEIERYRE